MRSLTPTSLTAPSLAVLAFAAACCTPAPEDSRPPAVAVPAGVVPLSAGDERPVPDAAVPSAVDNHLESHEMLPAACYAGSRIEDREALGGFAPNENFPRPITSPLARAAAALYLLAEPDVATGLGDGSGMRLSLVNPTDEVIAFSASDSRLAIVQEARRADGTWVSIEYLPSSFCGNSYHRVMLGGGEFWAFAVPRYRGSVETELRFRFDLGEGRTLVSNTFAGSVHPEQFTQRQAYQPTDLMDPTLPVERR